MVQDGRSGRRSDLAAPVSQRVEQIPSYHMETRRLPPSTSCLLLLRLLFQRWSWDPAQGHLEGTKGVLFVSLPPPAPTLDVGLAVSAGGEC